MLVTCVGEGPGAALAGESGSCLPVLSLVKCSVPQYSTVQCCGVECSALCYCAVQCSAVQCSAVPCSSVQFSELVFGAVVYSLVDRITGPTRLESTGYPEER